MTTILDTKKPRVQNPVHATGDSARVITPVRDGYAGAVHVMYARVET